MMADSMPYSDLFSLNQWCPYRYVWDDKRQKHTKPPVGKNPKGGINYDDSSTFWSFEDCIKYLVASPEGVISCGEMRTYRHGFIFPTNPCGIVAIDIDDCIVDGSIAEHTRQFIACAATYTEISPSGRGVRMFVLAAASGRPHIANYQGIPRIEVYASNGFVTTTHWHLPGTPITINRRQALIDDLLQYHATQQTTRGIPKHKPSSNQVKQSECSISEQTELSPTAKKVLKIALRDRKFEECFNCVDKAVMSQHGFRSASEGLFYLLMSLATRCRKRHNLIKEIIITAPVMRFMTRFLSKNRLDQQIQKACNQITFELPFVPTGRPKRPLKERIIAYLETGPKSRQQIYQRIRQQYTAAEMHVALRELRSAGIIRHKKYTKTCYEIPPVEPKQ